MKGFKQFVTALLRVAMSMCVGAASIINKSYAWTLRLSRSALGQETQSIAHPKPLPAKSTAVAHRQPPSRGGEASGALVPRRGNTSPASHLTCHPHGAQPQNSRLFPIIPVVFKAFLPMTGSHEIRRVSQEPAQRAWLDAA
jgi:hypothetical protein